jgi:hypothetical protein
MTIGQGLGVWLLGAVGLYLAMTAFQFPDAFTWILEGIWALASALLGLAVWRGDRRP